MAGIALATVGDGDGLSFDLTRGSRSDFPFSRPGRTILRLIIGGCMLFAGSEMERRRSSFFWRQEGTNYGCVEMMIRMKA